MTRREKAQFLYEKIELIDERYLEEAASYKPKKNKSLRALVTVIALASTFSIFLMLGIGSMLLRPPKTDMNQNNAYTDIFSVASGTHASYTSADELKESVLDGNGSYLIWQNTESEAYFTAKLTLNEERQLTTAKNTNRQVSDSDEPAKYKVWLKSSDGIVSSPELKDSSGNVTYRMVFDYEAELVLSEEFEKVLDSILR